MQNALPEMPGAIALAGSGEYTAAMDDADRYLIETLGGPQAARVALLPTASGLEPGMPAVWNEDGQRHFTKLGVRDIRSVNIVNALGAADPDQLALLRDANFFYFSGGNPQHLIESLRGSPAWDIISNAYAHGAVLAGCSAGAMALGRQTLSLRSAMAGKPAEWASALGVVPNVIVFPHFDRSARFLPPSAFQQMLTTVPAGSIILGIDEDTALVRLAAPSAGGAPMRWRVFGRQTVSVFIGTSQPRVLHAGDEVEL